MTTPDPNRPSSTHSSGSPSPALHPTFSVDTFSSPSTPQTPSTPSFSLSTPPPSETPRKSTEWLQYIASITPLICGGLGPTITLMALSGCADEWRDEQIDGRNLADRDPKWVIA